MAVTKEELDKIKEDKKEELKNKGAGAGGASRGIKALGNKVKGWFNQSSANAEAANQTDSLKGLVGDNREAIGERQRDLSATSKIAAEVRKEGITDDPSINHVDVNTEAFNASRTNNGVKNQIKETGENHDEDITKHKDIALEDFEALLKAANATNKETLSRMLNKNVARTGRFGNLNNDSFDHTLNMSRAVDDYNNAPKDRYRNMSLAGAGQVASPAGYHEITRPDITTQESRQMRANERLDERQRTDDLDLNAAIRKMDYDNFNKIFDSKVGITMNKEQSAIAMDTLRNSQELQQFLTKDMAGFQAALKETTAGRYANVISKLLTDKNPMVAAYVSYYLTGIVAPSKEAFIDAQGYAAIDNRLKEMGYNDPFDRNNMMRAMMSQDAAAATRNFVMNNGFGGAY